MNRIDMSILSSVNIEYRTRSHPPPSHAVTIAREVTFHVIPTCLKYPIPPAARDICSLNGSAYKHSGVRRSSLNAVNPVFFVLH